METAAFDAAHIDIAFVHKGFDEECEGLATGPEGGIGTDMWPERLHELEAPADVGDDLRQNSGSSTREHAQGHVRTWPHDLHKLLERKVGCHGFVAFLCVFEQCEGVAEWRTFTNGEEQIL